MFAGFVTCRGDGQSIQMALSQVGPQTIKVQCVVKESAQRRVIQKRPGPRPLKVRQQPTQRQQPQPLQARVRQPCGVSVVNPVGMQGTPKQSQFLHTCMGVVRVASQRRRVDRPGRRPADNRKRVYKVNTVVGIQNIEDAREHPDLVRGSGTAARKDKTRRHGALDRVEAAPILARTWRHTNSYKSCPISGKTRCGSNRSLIAQSSSAACSRSPSASTRSVLKQPAWSWAGSIVSRFSTTHSTQPRSPPRPRKEGAKFCGAPWSGIRACRGYRDGQNLGFSQALACGPAASR